jgi:hypothetical protein
MMFSGCSFVAALFCQFFIKETLGLEEKDKKLLFTPKKTDLVVPDERSEIETFK